MPDLRPIVLVGGELRQLPLTETLVSGQLAGLLLPPKVGDYFDSSQNATSNGAVSTTLRLEWHPYFSKFQTPIDLIGCLVSTLGAGAQARLGIYDSDPTTGFPGSKLFEGSGNLDASSVGYKSHSVSFTFQPGVLYWLACLTGSAAATYRSVPPGSLLPIRNDSAASNALIGGIRRTSGIVFTNPMPAVAGAIASTEFTGNINAVSIKMRVA